MLMFSATWPSEVRRLASRYLKDPVHINIGDDEGLNANKNITQNFLFITPGTTKSSILLNLLQEINPDQEKRPARVPKTIIFVQRRDEADSLSDLLYGEGYSVVALHGDKSQNARENIMMDFREGLLRVLVATDVASRGLDIHVSPVSL